MGITIVGLGAGDISQISFGAVEALKSGKKIFLRTDKHPVIEKLDIDYESFDSEYDSNDNFEAVYESISRKIVEIGKSEDIVYAVPGHPRVAESTVKIIEEYCKEEGINLEVIPSMSFVDAMFSYLGFDPSDGFRLLDSFSIKRKDLDINSNIIITQVYDRYIASNVKLELSEYYDDEQEVWIVRSAGIKDLEFKIKCELWEIDRVENEFDHLTSLYIPKTDKKKFKDFDDLIELVRTLRSEDGCPWDREQTHKSLTPYIVEEANEVVDAIEKDDLDGLIEELGDVLYNVVLHSQIGLESGYFDIYEVCDGIVEKMIFRHPHVFSNNCNFNDYKEINWEIIKKIEKSERKK